MSVEASGIFFAIAAKRASHSDLCPSCSISVGQAGAFTVRCYVRGGQGIFAALMLIFRANYFLRAIWRRNGRGVIFVWHQIVMVAIILTTS